jgi:hypothetical protein
MIENCLYETDDTLALSTPLASKKVFLTELNADSLFGGVNVSAVVATDAIVLVIIFNGIYFELDSTWPDKE